MNPLQRIAEQLAAGILPAQDASNELQQYIQKEQNKSKLSYANLDFEREQRTGFPEVVFGQGKTAEQIAQICKRLIEHNEEALATKVEQAKANIVLKELPQMKYDHISQILSFSSKPKKEKGNAQYVAVVCAGTSDLPVAEEAAQTLIFFNVNVKRIYDVGVAGIHRLFSQLDQIQNAEVIIVVAGMEGALTSVIGGLVDRPIISVPTSIGYGASFHGLSALLTMLNSCAPGVTVVNIDNGFGAAYSAAQIYRQIRKGTNKG